MDPAKKLVAWLQDAHAVKQHTEKALRRYADLPGGTPKLREYLLAHADETARHRATLEALLQALDSAPSHFGSAVATILGAGQSAASSLLGDPPLTSAAATLALEQLEVATLTAIAAAARVAGENPAATKCRAMAVEDSAFLTWLSDALPDLTRRYLSPP